MTTTTLADFFADRFRHNRPDDYIEIRTFQQDGKPGPRFWTRDPNEAARKAVRLPHSLAAYYGTAARTKGGGKKEHITAIPGAWADLDFKRYADSETGAWAALDAFSLPPTSVIHSGGGLQPYWEFTEPLTDQARFGDVETLLSRLAEHLDGDPAVAEVARVLRIPGSYNNKPEYGMPRQVAISRHNAGTRYTLADLARALPAPAPQERPQPEYPRGDHHHGDAPSVDEVAEMLHHLDPQPGYQQWVRILASVHSTHPGPIGIALCEAWSGHVSKPGEIAAKFASFGSYQGRNGNATIATLIYAAQQAGYRPVRATARHSTPSRTGSDPVDPDQPADTTHLFAERDATIATLRADVARLGDQVRAAQAALAELTEVREERDFYRQCLDCPDPVVGRALPAIAEELHRSYRAGSPHVQDGREYARLKLERAAEGKPINRSAITTAAERLAAGTPRAVIEVPIERNGREVKTNLQYFACPVEERASVARLGMGLLARTTLQQRHQGRKPPKIMPPAVVAQDAPVRREQRHIEAFYSLRDDTKLATQTTIGAIDYWTPSGEQLTQEEARDWQSAHGAGAVPVESQQHHVAPPRLFVGERKAVRSGGETQHTTINDKGVETQQGALPLDTPGQCLIKDCGNPIAVGGYCLAHYDVLRTAHVERYASGGYACAAGDD